MNKNYPIKGEMKTLKFTYWPKRITQGAALLSILSLSSVAPLTVIAADSATKDQPRIVQFMEPGSPIAIDDQGNAWCQALRSISVKDGYIPNLMVRATTITDVKSAAKSGGTTILLKKDGTVWMAEGKGRDETDLKENVSLTLDEKIPHLENIIKVDVLGMIGLALDRDGKVWIFEAPTSSLKINHIFHLKLSPFFLKGWIILKT